MTSKRKQLADKFAMKLGLESRYSIPALDLDSDDYELLNPPTESGEQSRVSQDSLKYDNTPTKSLRMYLKELQFKFHTLSTNVDLEDYEDAIADIEDMRVDLSTIERGCRTRMRARKSA